LPLGTTAAITTALITILATDLATNLATNLIADLATNLATNVATDVATAMLLQRAGTLLERGGMGGGGLPAEDIAAALALAAYCRGPLRYDVKIFFVRGRIGKVTPPLTLLSCLR
jgi:hypothetical protein